MKKRKGFHRIVVDGKEYLYDVSLTTHKLIVYDSNDIKHELLTMDVTEISGWFGKRDRGVFGPKQAAELIKKAKI